MRLRQVPHHEPRTLVDERVEDLAAVKDCCMRQRLDRGDAHECRNIRIDGTNLIPVPLNVSPEHGVVLSVEGFYIPQLSRAWNLLCQHAMQLGIDAMSRDRYRDQLAHSLLERKHRDLRQCATGNPHEVVLVPIDHGRNERLLAGKILIERTDAHARLLSDAIGAGSIKTLSHQNASGSFDKRIDRRS